MRLWQILKRRRNVARYVDGVVEDAAPTVVVVRFAAKVFSPGSTYGAGVTVQVQGVGVTINQANRQPDGRTVHYVIAATVAAGESVTWAYNSGPGDLETEATGKPVPTTAAQPVRNLVGVGAARLDFQLAANSQYVAAI